MSDIALSGFGMEEDAQESKGAGIAAHLTKLVNLAQLEEIFRTINATTP